MPEHSVTLRDYSEHDRYGRPISFERDACPGFLFARRCKSLPIRFEERAMSDTDYLSLQASIICVLLFILGTTAILERPEWFY